MKKTGAQLWMIFVGKCYPVETRQSSTHRETGCTRGGRVVSATRSELANRFLNEVHKVLRLLEPFPNVGGPVFGVTDEATGQMPVDTFPYHVVFKRFRDRISVLALLTTGNVLVIGTSRTEIGPLASKSRPFAPEWRPLALALASTRTGTASIRTEIGFTRIGFGSTRIDIESTRIDIGSTRIETAFTPAGIESTRTEVGSSHIDFEPERGSKDAIPV